MLRVKRQQCKRVINIEQYSKDGRLTEHFDGTVFDYREMVKVVKETGRPLTRQEAERYRIK